VSSSPIAITEAMALVLLGSQTGQRRITSRML
jgi:hypothetical protein